MLLFVQQKDVFKFKRARSSSCRCGAVFREFRYCFRCRHVLLPKDAKHDIAVAVNRDRNIGAGCCVVDPARNWQAKCTLRTNSCPQTASGPGPVSASSIPAVLSGASPSSPPNLSVPESVCPSLSGVSVGDSTAASSSESSSVQKRFVLGEDWCAFCSACDATFLPEEPACASDAERCKRCRKERLLFIPLRLVPEVRGSSSSTCVNLKCKTRARLFHRCPMCGSCVLPADPRNDIPIAEFCDGIPRLLGTARPKSMPFKNT